VTGTFARRLGCFTVALALGMALCAVPAPAAINMAIGPQRTVPNAPVTDCDARAQSALTSVLQTPFEAGQGTGEWLAYAQVEAPATPPQAASIHCFPIDNGYLVTFECAVVLPDSSVSADDFCTKVSAAFDASSPAPSAAPSVAPSASPTGL
jgi:hypothetical protein